VSGRPRGRRPRMSMSQGTRVLLISLGLYVLIAVLIWLFPALRFTPVRPAWAGAAGWVLLLASLGVWFVAARTMRAAYGAGQLPTTGLFGLVRHPIYSAFILLQGPGLILWLWGWPALVLPFAAYGLSRSAIRSEEERLSEHFGPLYETYRRRVPALLPWPRRRPQPPPGAGGELVNRKVASRKAAASRSAARRRKDGSDSHLRGL
jgi:protein-S-isoprenylcysteine O-methyltransferase Ste14